ncbi:protein FAM243A [Varanus komodoensis]|uniref:Protein FAM243A n=1 Tax=Varanus komodoensis TaxID=61221 RepID=A0A8D2LMM9_VARKO|nr:protein FAM243A [Varanus komodoensis]
MYRIVNPLLKNIIHRSLFDATSRKQCLQYLKTLRTLQLNGYNTIFLGETDISESLITGEKVPCEDSLSWPIWSIVHAGNSQGWVPWRYRVFLRDDLPLDQQEDVFQEFCDFLSITYGKCAIVVKERKLSRAKMQESSQQLEITEPQSISLPSLLTINCCPETAKATGHELLSVPFPYSYLHPMDAAWSSLKWFIINNRKEFSLISLERTYSYQCILFSDLIGKGIEKMNPNKWKVAVSKVRRWENYYLDKFS